MHVDEISRSTRYLPQARELVEKRKDVYTELRNPALCARHIHPLRLPEAKILTSLRPSACIQYSMYSTQSLLHTEFAKICLSAGSDGPH